MLKEPTLNVAVLFLLYNRPFNTERVFEAFVRLNLIVYTSLVMVPKAIEWVIINGLRMFAKLPTVSTGIVRSKPFFMILILVVKLQLNKLLLGFSSMRIMELFLKMTVCQIKHFSFSVRSSYKSIKMMTEFLQ